MEQQINRIEDSFMHPWSQHIHSVYMDRDWQITASNQILNDIILVQVVNDGNTA